MNADAKRSGASTRARGFTLLEVMVTLAVIGGALVLVLRNREDAMTNYFQARNANIARNLARELLSEISFKELDALRGKFEGFPDFEYEVEITYEDLVTGEDEEQEDDDPFSTGRDWKGQESDSGSSSSGFVPGDAIDKSEDEQAEYPVRRVKLTIFYPNLKDDSDDPEPLKLVVETILPPLPDEGDEEFLGVLGERGKSSSNNKKSKSGR